jgi:hypothetical protein
MIRKVDMMKKVIKEEYITAFIEKWSIPFTPREIIKKNLLLYIFATLPVALLGIYKEITVPLLLGSIVIMSIWALCIYKNINKYNEQVDLFIGLSFALLSCVIMIGSYKLMVTFRSVSSLDVFLAILGYILTVAFMLVFCVHNIKKGYYVEKKTNLTKGGIITSASLFGAFAGRSISQNLSDSTSIVFFAYSLLFFSYMLSFAYIYLLKYYFVKRLASK